MRHRPDRPIFLAMAWASTVIGSDICHNSLKLAAGFQRPISRSTTPILCR